MRYLCRSIIATNSNFTTAADPPFKNVPILPSGVWILPPTGPPRVLVGWTDLPNGPNGLAVSEDEQTLYVTVSTVTEDPLAIAAVNQLFAFDLVNIDGGYFATRKRTFATSDFGSFGALKVDTKGNIFVAADDGVQVCFPTVRCALLCSHPDAQYTLYRGCMSINAQQSQ